MSNNRELVSVEQAMEILNSVASTLNVITISCISGLLTEELVRQALDLVQCRHPRLNSRIVGSFNTLRFETEGTQKIPLRIVEKADKEQWQEVALEELNEKIESDKCLMRAVLVRNHSDNNSIYLITTLHHAITDGLSSIRLHQEILSYCQRIACGESITQVPSLPVLLPVDELLPKSMKGFRGKVKGTLFLLWLRLQEIWHQPQTLKCEKSVPTELRRCGLVHRTLEQALTQQLIKNCRDEQTTVQGALCAAILLTVAKNIKTENQTNVRVNCQSYVDLRKQIKPIITSEGLGIFASSLTSFHTLRKNTLFWDLAREVRQKIELGLKRGDVFYPIPMIRTMVASLLARSHKPFVTSAITNVGQVNIPSVYTPFILKEINFMPAQAAFGGIVTMAVTTFEGKMLLNFTYSEPSISQNTMENLANSVMSCLVEVCSNCNTKQN